MERTEETLMDSRQRAVRTAVTNVRVFDGRQLLPLGTVVIEGSRIGASGPLDTDPRHQGASCASPSSTSASV